MLNDKVRAELEQGQELLVEVIPSLLHAFYSRLIKEGFTDANAFELTKVYLANFSRGIQ